MKNDSPACNETVTLLPQDKRVEEFLSTTVTLSYSRGLYWQAKSSSVIYSGCQNTVRKHLKLDIQRQGSKL